jgi:hypothetical protein
MSRELPSALLKRDAGLLGVCGLLFAASPTRLLSSGSFVAVHEVRNWHFSALA